MTTFWIVSLVATLIFVHVAMILKTDVFNCKSIGEYIVTILFSGIPILNFLLLFLSVWDILDYILFGKQKRLEKNEERLKIEKEKYSDSLQKLHDINRSFGYYKISEILSSIINSYSIIIINDSHKDIAFNRVEYLATFLNECTNNKMIHDTDIMKEIISIAESVDKLLLEIVKDIEDTKNKVNKQVKEYLLSKTNEFKNVTNSMTNDFKSTK